MILKLGSGEGEIRTHDTLPYDGFQDRCLKPLGHLTAPQPFIYFFCESLVRWARCLKPLGHLTVVDYLRVHWSQFIAEMQEWQQLSVEIKMAV